MRFNHGKRHTASYLPNLRGAHVQLVEVKADKKAKSGTFCTWTATINVNGWPHDIKLWGQDELDIFKKAHAMFKEHGAHVVGE